MPFTFGFGVIVSRSTPMIELIVLMSERASAPPRTAARPGGVMLVTFGVSLTITARREQTLTIGSPSVFQTAPPQPASNARSTIDPMLVGGADASQNGFGDAMPAKSTLRSAMTLHLLQTSPLRPSAPCGSPARRAC